MEIIKANTQIFNEQASEIKNINRLLRVALINSYPEGKIHLLDVDNNTIITGRNASGKTTLMGVIAPFFGVPLSSIARQSEVKQSFIDFYLPFENSYIVYEYQRDGQQFCVLLRRRGDTPIFHFINSSYDENWFIHIEQNQRYFNNYAQVKESIENQQCIISTNLLHSEYEA
ncbi:ATP-binding protein, partial [Salmonella enterica subsp. enterica]|nr:ATP-binding protein [Salmonella enterica subsp. enterica]